MTTDWIHEGLSDEPEPEPRIVKAATHDQDAFEQAFLEALWALCAAHDAHAPKAVLRERFER